MTQTSPDPVKPTPRIRDRLSGRLSGAIGGTYRAAKDRYQRSPRLQRLIWQHRVAPAFWTTASLLSLAINIFLIAALLIVGRQLFMLKTAIDKQLLTGLYDNFALMDQAHIVTTISVETTIQVQDTIPVVFDLLLSQDTEVILTQDTPVENVSILLNGVWIPTNIILPAGTPLGINLDITVPVSQTVPVNLTVPVSLQVPVDIPLDQTELHEPFAGLQQVVAPYRMLLSNTPDSAIEIDACQSWWAGWICRLVFGTP
jgi:hypothetical protein